MPTTSAPVVKTGLTPPLVAMIQQLKKMTQDRTLRCYALAGPAKQRCSKSYQPWTEKLEPLLHTVRNSAPPFDTRLSTKLAHVLLCDEHRKHEIHVMPLRHELSTVQRTPKSLLEKGSRDDSDAPRPGKRLLPSLDCGSTRRARAKSAEHNLETPPALPSTNPVDSIDARWELNHEGTIHCIAYDTVAGRCGHKLYWQRLEIARRIISSGLKNETSDEAESDGTYKDSEREETISPRKLRRLLRQLLCTHHRQWFWVEFYYSRWQAHLESGNTSGENSEFWEDSGPDTDESRGNFIFQSSSDSAVDGEDSSDPEATPSAPIQDSIRDTSVVRASPPRRGSNASTSSTYTPTEFPNTPKRPTGRLAQKAHTDPGRVIRSSKGSPTSPCDPRTPSISVSRAVSASSLPPSPGLQLRRSPRLAARRLSSYREVRDPSLGESVDDDVTHLTGSLSKLRLGANATILSYAWSLLIGDSLYKEVMKTLKNSENTGCIYIIVSQSHPGHVKVGKTIQPAKRQEELRSCCKLDDLTMETFENVEQHDRVEALVHRHLERFQRITPCARGTKVTKHKEWFRCDPELARRVVEAWAKWMAKKPYRHKVLWEYWSKRAESLKLGVKEGQQETFEELFQRHERWTQQ